MYQLRYNGSVLVIFLKSSRVSLQKGGERFLIFVMGTLSVVHNTCLESFAPPWYNSIVYTTQDNICVIVVANLYALEANLYNWRFTMRKQLFGIGLILLGIIFAILSQTFDIWIPIIDISSYLWGALSLVSGISGIIIVFLNIKDNS